MKYCFILLTGLLILSSCHEKHHHLSKEAMAARMDSLKHDLLKTDIAFSELSQQKGRNFAFIEYADSNATLLRSYSLPITGKDSIVYHYSIHSDTAHLLSWVPVYADVARSGDLGYTFGTFTLAIKGNKMTTGTYCTVWKKDKTHHWKFVLDTGNEGLKPEDE